ncbi:MAG: hypothetical protein ACRDY1_04500 [Acidimicrobiales bacterium]
MTTVVRPAPDMGAGAGATSSAETVASSPQPRRLSPSWLSSSWLSSSWPGQVGLVLVVCFVVSVVTLGRASLSLDESVSATLAKSPWHVFTQTVLHRETNMVLYYALLRLWDAAASPVLGGVAGPEAVLRSLSVLASVAAVAVVMVVTRRLFGPRVALVCGALLALDPLVVMFAQDARGYALSLLLVSGSSALFVRGIGFGGGDDAQASAVVWVAYAALSALAAYANFWAALVPLAHAVSLAFVPAGTVPWRRLVPTAVGLGALLVPLGLLIRASDSAGVNWAAGSSAGKLISKVRADVPHAVIDLAALAAVAVVVALVVLVRRRPSWHVPLERWPVVFTLCWLLVPIAAVVLLSLTYKPLLVLRYLVVCLPPLLMLVAYALSRLGPARAVRGALATLALLALSLAGTGALAAHGSPQNWRGAVASVTARSEPGDGVIVFAPYTRIPFQWYVVRQAAVSNLHPLFPAGAWSTDALRYDSSITLTRSAIEAAASARARVWLVLSQQELYPAEETALAAGLRAAGLAPGPPTVFHGVEVVLYTARS